MSIGLTKAFLNFENTREIGQEGQNSTVFIAHDKQLDAEIVIKKIDKATISGADVYFEEARRLYDSSHPYVVPIKYACEDDGFVYIAMPYYQNGSLKKLIESRFLTVREIIRYSIQFLQGLHNIHIKSLVHFDLKPDNILLSDSNEALVSDFGLAKAMDCVGLSEPDMAYTAHVPPEYYAQTKHSNLYDIYAAGLTIYRLCNGSDHFYSQATFNTDDEFKKALRSGSFPNRQAYLPHIPKELRSAITNALKVDQNKRTPNALIFLNELSKVNSLLDWQYSEENGEKIWQLIDDTRKIRVVLTQNGSNFNLRSTKTMIATGNTQNISKGCQRNLQPSDVNGTINELLLSLDR